MDVDEPRPLVAFLPPLPLDAVSDPSERVDLFAALVAAASGADPADPDDLPASSSSNFRFMPSLMSTMAFVVFCVAAATSSAMTCRRKVGLS